MAELIFNTWISHWSLLSFMIVNFARVASCYPGVIVLYHLPCASISVGAATSSIKSASRQQVALCILHAAEQLVP